MNTQEVTDLITSKIEDEATPALILEWCERNQGKRLRQNNVPTGFEVSRRYGMTQLINTDYWTKDAVQLSYLICHSETGATVPTIEVMREKNTCYYKGLEERNAFRRELLASPKRLAQLQATIDRCKNAVSEYRASFECLAEIADYPNPERHDLERFSGKLEEKR